MGLFDWLPKIKNSGTKSTVVTTRGVASTSASIRSTDTSPMKGTRNPAHIHVKMPKGKGS
jgi:hypothetical protein